MFNEVLSTNTDRLDASSKIKVLIIRSQGPTALNECECTLCSQKDFKILIYLKVAWLVSTRAQP